MYKFELHAHSKPTSLCSTVTPQQIVDLLIQRGYNGVAITNHFYREWFTNEHDSVKPEMSDEQKIEIWLGGYLDTKKAAEGKDFNVVLGAELRFPETGANDYLLYGMDEEFMLEHPRIWELNPKKIFELAEANDLYFGQAHPSRDTCYPVDPAILHGMEVFNQHPRLANDMCNTYNIVKKNNLISTVGTDMHYEHFCGKAAIMLDRNPSDSRELASMLLSKREWPLLIPKQAKLDTSLPFYADDRYIFED